MRKRFVVALVAALVLSWGTLGLGSAQALTTTYTGTIDSSDPEMLVAVIDTPVCFGSYGITDVHYEVVPLPDPVSGTHTFELTWGPAGSLVAMYLMEGSFDPEAAVDTCVAATNSGTDVRTLSYDLKADTPYFLVLIDDSGDQRGADYTVVVTSPDPPPPTTDETTDPTPADIDCDDVSAEEAQAILDQDPSDPHQLDADGDGIACEQESATAPAGTGTTRPRFTG